MPYAYGYEDYYDEHSNYTRDTDRSSVARSYDSNSNGALEESERTSYVESTAGSYDSNNNSSALDETERDSAYEEQSAYDEESRYDQAYARSRDPYEEYDEYFSDDYEDEDDEEYDDYEEYFEEEENPLPPFDTFQFEDPNTATREVNVSKFAFSVSADDELPDSYKNLDQYGQYLHLPKRNEPTKVDEQPKRRKPKQPIRMLPNNVKSHHRYPFTKRKYYTLTTIVAAVALVATGIYLSTQSLATVSPQQFKSSYIDKDAQYLFLPKFYFGGMTGGIRGDVQRRANVDETALLDPSYETLPGMVVPILRNSNNVNAKLNNRKEPDPYHGFGPAQFYPGQSVRSDSKATLTSGALTSYNPPSETGPIIVLDPMFHGSMMDVSHLPYNPVREIPVFWDVPMTGGQRIQYIFGHCLKLIQCSEVGKDLLSRQAEVSGVSVESYDPPLNSEFIRSSTYANVDCSTSSGIERGRAHDLATSNTVDVIYSPNIMDVARLFLPPVEAYGRGIVLIRDPIDRVVALYEYLNVAKHGDSNGVNKMSLEQFVRSGKTRLIICFVPLCLQYV